MVAESGLFLGMENRDTFTSHFGTLCHTLFKPEKTLSQMFVDGKSPKDLFAELSEDLDAIGKIVYKEEWESLKQHIKESK